MKINCIKKISHSKFKFNHIKLAKEKSTLTNFGLYLAQRSVNKSQVSEKTGISKTRMTRLTTQANSHLRASELYLIALAIEADPCDLIKFLYKDHSLIK